MASDACGLKSCKSGRTSGGTSSDQLIQLGHEIVLSILSNLTFKEATRTSVLSRRWRDLWRQLRLYFPGTFIFEPPREVKLHFSGYAYQALLREDACNFVSWVTRVVDHHIGSSIEEFKVSFPLSNSFHYDIDKWVLFAVSKGAKSLVLDLNHTNRTSPMNTIYALPDKCRNFINCPALKTLFLRHIDITTELIDCFLQYCPLLENLCIHKSTSLTSIRASLSPLALKHLDVSDCSKLENIEITAPKLETFKYLGQRIQLDIRNASLLSEVSIGGATGEPIAYAFDWVSEKFLQVNYLNMVAQLFSQREAYIGSNEPINLRIPPVLDLTNLKHLKLTIYARPMQTLLGWITFIEACPVLEKLTLELSTRDHWYPLAHETSGGEYGNALLLRCLKILELRGFVGCRVDLEFATYVIKKTVVLEQLVIDFKIIECPKSINPRLYLSKERAERLRKRLPTGQVSLLNGFCAINSNNTIFRLLPCSNPPSDAKVGVISLRAHNYRPYVASLGTVLITLDVSQQLGIQLLSVAAPPRVGIASLFVC